MAALLGIILKIIINSNFHRLCGEQNMRKTSFNEASDTQATLLPQW
jgi:hypothetical protein